MAKCCFDKIPLRGIFEPIWPFGTELYARMLYLESSNTKVLLVAMDSLCTSPDETARFRSGVSEHTGIPTNNIWYHELQAHAAPDSLTLLGENMDRLVERASEKVLSMIAQAVPYHCEVAEADVGTRFSMNREQYIHGLGGVTIWNGLGFDEEGRAWTNDPSIMLLRGYQPDLPALKEPVYFDNTVDSKAYLFVFRNEQENVLGVLSRFAAHPDVAVLFEHRNVEHNYHYCFDWPGYMTEKLEKAFSAPGMYINGPCADLATKKVWDDVVNYETAAAECKRIGEELADALLARYQQKHAALGNPDHLRAAMFTFELPVRDDFPKSLAALQKQLDQLPEMDVGIQEAIDKKVPAYQIKTMIDNRWRCMQDKVTIHDCVLFNDEKLAKSTLPVTVSVMQLGDYLFVGVPGESLVDMTMWLRSTFTGVKTIPVDQVNGYYNYMATPRSLTLGGYTYWSSWVSRRSIPLLKEGIVREMEEWLDS